VKTKTHWEGVYTANPVTEVSWFQEHSELSLRMIEGTGVAPMGHIIDVGGGASTLVDDLLARHFESITVLDISAAALSAAHERLGLRPRASAMSKEATEWPSRLRCRASWETGGVRTTRVGRKAIYHG